MLLHYLVNVETLKMHVYTNFGYIVMLTIK